MASTRPSSASSARLFRAGALAIALFSITWLVPRAHARPVEGLPYITDVQIVGEQPCDTCPPQVCPLRPIVIRISGVRVDGCVHYQGLQVFPQRGSPVPLIFADFVVDSCGGACPAVFASFTDSVTIPGLAPGPAWVWIESHVRSCPDTSQIARTGARRFAVDVLGTCGDPVPVDSLLRSFVSFRVFPEHPCPTDSIRIQMTKNGCPPCFRFDSFNYSSELGLLAQANWRSNCIELACFMESLSVALPGRFSAGHYVIVANMKVDVLDTPVADSSVSFSVSIPFDVFQTCDTTQAGCVSPELFAATGSVDCAIHLEPGGEGALTLYTRTPVPLGGLQGEIFCPPPFRVTGVFPPDLPGIHVSWVPEGERGARYVVFTTGEPIGPRTSPVLKLALAADTGSTPGMRAELHPVVRLASDPSGTAVPVCDISNIRLAGTPLCIGGGAEACDVNHDGHPDVLDLVSMTTCLRVDLPPGGSELCPDCNASGSWEFGDLFCCAQRILRLPIVPRDSVGDGPFVTIEEITRDEVGAELRIRLSGAGPLGAAMLRLRYPAERWQAFDMRIVPLDTRIAPRASATAGEGWFPIVDTELPGVLQLGGLRIAAEASQEIEFLVRFIPIGGPRDDDELVVEGADLASSDGSAFTIASLPRFTIPPPTVSPIARIELGPARPNPFARTTNFTVSLPQAAHVELTMHDLFGRRVATLLSGSLPAGRQDATWNAGSARDGVYFARLVVNGRVFTQRVALLRDRR